MTIKTHDKDALIVALARALVCEVADPENPGHIRSCPTSDDRHARCSQKCETISKLASDAGDSL